MTNQIFPVLVYNMRSSQFDWSYFVLYNSDLSYICWKAYNVGFTFTVEKLRWVAIHSQLGIEAVQFSVFSDFMQKPKICISWAYIDSKRVILVTKALMWFSFRYQNFSSWLRSVKKWCTLKLTKELTCNFFLFEYVYYSDKYL